MSLDWTLDKVKDYQSLYRKVDDGYQLNSETNAVIWASMAVGISTITEENYLEFAVRSQWARCFTSAKGDATLEECIRIAKRHIGLTTNASRKTDAQFLKAEYEYALKDAAFLDKSETHNGN